MLSPGQIGRMRSTADRALPDTAVIQRRETVSDGGGGQTTTWATLATVACRISPLGVPGGDGEREEAGRIADESRHVVTFAADTDVTEADRLVISARTYVITLVRTRAAWELTRRCEVREAP